MPTARKPDYRPGINMALKTPPHAFEATVRFYRDVHGFEQLADKLPNVCFQFREKRLWIDNVPTQSRSELRLEVIADDPAAAAAHLAAAGIVRCDAIEPLPQGFEGFWIMDPAGTVCIVAKQS